VDQWREASNDDTSAWGLIEDEKALREVAKNALKTLDRETGKRSADHLRPFRDLKKNPTEKRFRSLLRRGDDATRDFNRSMVQRAARRLQLISDDLTDDGVNLIAVNPGHVRAVATLVCELFASRLAKDVQDKGFESFGLEVCRIYEELTGKIVTYATSTKPGAHRPAEKRSGRGLDVVLGACRRGDCASASSKFDSIKLLLQPIKAANVRLKPGRAGTPREPQRRFQRNNSKLTI
jgi:hypothetical protein